MTRERGDMALGIFLNNPGNLEWGSPWQGLVKREKSHYYQRGTAQQQRFCEFQDAAFGIRAIVMTLMTYHDKRKARDGSRIDTIREVVERWAPAFENNVEAYARHVANHVGTDPDDVLDFNDYDTMCDMVTGIIAHENAGYKYPPKVMEEGLRRAGFVKPVQVSPATPAQQVPVNVETVAGAAAPIAIGAAQITPILPDVAAAITNQQDNLVSGEWMRVAIAVALVGIGVTVAWSQYKRRKAGAI